MDYSDIYARSRCLPGEGTIRSAKKKEREREREREMIPTRLPRSRNFDIDALGAGARALYTLRQFARRRGRDRSGAEGVGGGDRPEIKGGN